MNPNQVIDDIKKKFRSTLEHYGDELRKVRTGRASASMLDGVMVTAYGVQMPLNQVANVTAPEAQLIQITPFDPNNIQAIAAAIRDNPTLGLNPSDDGRIVRVPIPPLTEERRREYVKVLSGKVEDCMIAMRAIRHEAMDVVAEAKKNKSVGEDEAKRLEKQIDEAMSKTKAEVEQLTQAKQSEIMTV